MKAIVWVIYIMSEIGAPTPLEYGGYGQRFSDVDTCKVAAEHVSDAIYQNFIGPKAVCVPIQWEKTK